MPWLEVLHPNLILFTLVVNITVRRHLWFGLVFEESIMQYLIVNIDFAHLGLHALSHFLLQSLCLVSLCSLLPQFRDASLLDELWQLEGNLVDASLVLQIAPLLCPVAWNRH